MNKQELFELLRLDPKKVADPVEYWALYATSFYERLLAKIDDTKEVERVYKRMVRNPKLNKKAQDALTFFYMLRMDELENPDFWDMQSGKVTENMKAKFINESLNESMSRYCDFYKTQDGKWYMDLANDEYGEWDESTTYGPFSSEEATEKYLDDNFSNPGGMGVDDSGERSVPTESPNGSRVVNPRSGGGGGRSSFGRDFRGHPYRR
jgi:hypothetical protein